MLWEHWMQRGRGEDDYREVLALRVRCVGAGEATLFRVQHLDMTYDVDG